MSVNSEHRLVNINGGTFFLCFWLFIIGVTLDNIEDHLGELVDLLKAQQQQTAVKP